MRRRNRTVRIIFFLILLTIIELVAQRIDQSLANPGAQNDNFYQKDIKYVPFPNELKKYEVYPWEVLEMPDFSKSYRAIIGLRIKEKWLRLLDGPSTLNKMIATPQGNLVIVNSCKIHECGPRHILILFNPVTKQIWALLFEEGKKFLLGNPDNGMKELMGKIEHTTWSKPNESN
jgi:hypothetical protein